MIEYKNKYNINFKIKKFLIFHYKPDVIIGLETKKYLPRIIIAFLKTERFSENSSISTISII